MTSATEIDRSIGRLAVPAVLTAAADPLYELTDTAILGRLGTAALGGAALAGAVLVTTYGIFIFLLFGTTAAVARLSGEGRHRAAAERGIQSMWVGLAIGTTLAIAGIPAAGPIIGVLGGTGEVADAALTYLRISLAGLPALFVVMAGAGYLRGRGDTRTPLWLAWSGVILNLVVEIVLIYGLGAGVAGSAAGTVIAKTTVAVAFAVIVVRSARAHRARLAPLPRRMLATTTAGVPLIVRTAALRLAVGGAAVAAARLGEHELAAYAIGFQVWSFLAYVGDGLEVSGQVLVARGLGRAEPARARLAADRILRFGALGGLSFAVALLAVHRVLPTVFTPDARVRELTATSLAWVAAMQPVNLIAFSLDGILVGADDLWFLAGAMVAATTLFAPIAWLVASRDLGLSALWLTVAGFMVTRVGILGGRYLSSSWLKPTR